MSTESKPSLEVTIEVSEQAGEKSHVARCSKCGGLLCGWEQWEPIVLGREKVALRFRKAIEDHTASHPECNITKSQHERNSESDTPQAV